MLCRILLVGFSLLFATVAQAQTYPDRPIRLIAPFPAGGLADVLARAVGDEMSKTLGQPVIVENRAGAGGNTGADAVAKAFGVKIDHHPEVVARFQERFGDDLTASEVRYLMKEEFARFADDILWRRSKLGLTMSRQDRAALDTFMAAA